MSRKKKDQNNKIVIAIIVIIALLLISGMVLGIYFMEKADGSPTSENISNDIDNGEEVPGTGGDGKAV